MSAPSQKLLGLIGGMSWESTVPYYRLINEAVKERLGGLHSARLVLYSVDFHEIERLQHEGDWRSAGAVLASAARSLEHAGAQCIVLCTNTMHKVAADVEASVSIPLLHIADPADEAVKATAASTVGLLGTRFTMEESFYRERLERLHGLNVLIPGRADRDIVHRVIYEELCQGRIEAASRDEYRRIIGELVQCGAQAVILVCTEISLLVSPADAPVPLFDTTNLHARRAAEWALQGS